MMSFVLPFNSKIKDNTVKRFYNGNIINQYYNLNLRNLVMKMINDDPNKRPTAFQAFDELIMIEQSLSNSNISPITQNNINFQYNSNFQANFQNNLNFQNNSNFQNNLNNNYISQQNIQNSNLNSNNFCNCYPNNQTPFFLNPLYLSDNQLGNLMNIQNQKQNMNMNNLMNNQNIINQKANYNYNNNSNSNSNSNNNSNNNNNSINNNISMQENKNNSDNNSLIRVIQCLYELKILDIENLKKKISSNIGGNGYCMSLEILNMIKETDNRSLGISDERSYVNILQSLKNKFNMNQDEPKNIFKAIFSIFNKDFINSNIPLNIKLFNNKIEPEKLPKNSFPELYKKIEGFKKEFNNPFVDIFYFISLDLKTCPDCENIFEAEPSINYSFPIHFGKKGQEELSNIIQNYFNKKSKTKDNYNCPICFYRGPLNKEKALFNAPIYLLVELKIKNKTQEKIVKEIDLGSYKISDFGFQKYSLFGLISKDSNDKYISFFKNEEDSWNFYSDVYNIEKYPSYSIKNNMPCIAIFEGIL